MKKGIIFAFICLIQQTVFSQLETLDLKNTLVVALLDKAEDRFTLEVNLTEILAQQGIKTMASLNSLKQGSDIKMIAYDSIKTSLKTKGIDTYVLVSVRGYDTKFKKATIFNDLTSELGIGHSFPLYRDAITSISLEFNFYRDGKHVAYDLVRLTGTSTRDQVIKKLRKKMPKRINKYWK